MAHAPDHPRPAPARPRLDRPSTLPTRPDQPLVRVVAGGPSHKLLVQTLKWLMSLPEEPAPAKSQEHIRIPGQNQP